MKRLFYALALLVAVALPLRWLSAPDHTAAAPPVGAGTHRTSFAELPPAAQTLIASSLGQDDPAYHAGALPGGWRLTAPGRDLNATFDQAGARMTLGADDWRLRALAWGRGGTLTDLDAAVAPDAAANRVEYRRGPVTEWYVNSPLGLEQGLTLAQPPSPAGADPLVLTLSTGGTLAAVPEGDGLALRAADGRRVLTYRGLVAYDADGQALPARLELRGAALALVVDDRQARYPVVVDPYIQQAKLTAAGGTTSDNLGYSVAVSADGATIVAGAQLARIGSNATQGAAYVYVKPGGGWATATQTAKLTAADGAASDWLGYSVAISADGATIVAGAYQADIGTKTDQGAAYVFVKPGGGWANATQTAKLTAADGAASDGLGRSLAVSADGSIIVAGAYHATIGSKTWQGAAYVYVKPGGGWANATQTAKLTAADGAYNDNLGQSVAVSADGATIVAGAEKATIGGKALQGAAYVYVKPGGGWANATQTAKLTAADGATYDQLGWSVAVSADGATIVAGAYYATIGGHTSQGAAYVYVKPGGGWAIATQTAKLTAADGAASDQFGWSVAVSNNGATIVAGANGATIGSNAKQGAVYVYVKPGGGWATATQTAKLTAADGAAYNQLGQSVAVSTDGTTVIVGAPSAAATYVFTPNANLSNLTLSTGTLSPTFAAATTSYTASVANSVTSLTVTPTAADAAATIQVRVNGGSWSSVASGSASGSLPLNVGSNSVEVMVTAAGGSPTKTYTVTVTRASPSSNANLSALTLSSGTLFPAFSSGQTSYTDAVANAVTSLTVTPTAADATATIKVRVNSGVYAVVASGSPSAALTLNVGANPVDIQVTAADNTVKTYTVTVTRAALSATTTGVTASPNPVAFGQSVTFTATVAPAAATGTVDFRSDGTTLAGCGARALAGGTAGCPSAALAVGTHAITAAYSGDATYAASSGILTGGQVVNRASQTISFGALGDQTYGAADVTLSAVGGASDNPVTFASLTTGVCTTGGTNGATLHLPAAGTCTVRASQAGNGNYQDATAVDRSFTVNRALAGCSVSPYSLTYDGNPHAASGACTGIGGGGLAGLDLSATTHTGAGTYVDDPWTFTDVTGNYQNAAGLVTDRIAKAAANCAVTGWSGTYDGAPHGAGGACTGVGGATLSGLTPGAGYTNVPGGTAGWAFSNANYADQSGTVAITIGRAATRIVTAPTAGSLVLGQALSAASLTNGSGSVPGGFAWSAPATVPAAGISAQGIIFTPTDNTNYSGTTGAVNVTVLVPVTIATANPGNLDISVDHTAYVAPHTFYWAWGESHSIAVTQYQHQVGGTRAVFAAWSDGGALSHAITVPATAATYTASFGTQYQVSSTANPGGTAAVLRLLDGVAQDDDWFAAGTPLELKALAIVGYQFSSWGGDLGGSDNPVSVTLTAPLTLVANTALITGAPSLMTGPGITKSGASSARDWVFTLTNSGTGAATNVSITGLTLTPTTTPTCTPVIATAFPVSLGTIAAESDAGGTVSIGFSGCPAAARFKAVFTYTYDGAPATAPTKSYSNQFR